MNNIDPHVLLGNLKDTLAKIKTLIAWQQLKLAEQRPGQPPGFTAYDPTERDLRYEYSSFLAMSGHLEIVLDSVRISKNKHKQITCEYMGLLSEFRSLNIKTTFTMPD